ncbi:zinc finger CCCH domain-containing protein 7A [Gadus chalcogrammus]|uniref:zinc finger CCCH domain-containing protein 7A n=1 Tax=Gadus chalcogrammus TaxID=1042646 RepID=UPI0024C307EE|nr:zinc finger CCCH domain-containing protein 7A [Gadus chalcogrammus]XP_056434543.1 zinc finger CCCH domain-containing protein 7A [Gadus chalcogrammus]
MSGICQDRRSRWQEIQKGLQFIQSTLPYPGTQEQYEVFIKDLVLNLFGEGNDVFKEGEWTKSIEMYTEALSIAEYADSEEIAVPMGLLENLYVNRAASYLNIVPGLYDQGLKDCEKALELNEGNYKAHYRKAKSLREMGRHAEAYEAVAKCSLVVPQDPSVIHLTQELAKALGLKIRKAYIRSKPALNVATGASYSEASCDNYTHGPSSVEDIDTEVPRYGVNHVPMPVHLPLTVAPPLNDHLLDDAHSSSSSSPLPIAEPPPAPGFHHLLPAPLPVHPCPSPAPLTAGPALVNGSGACHHSHPLLDDDPDCDAELIGDDLDDLLDQARPADCPMGMSAEQGQQLLMSNSVASGSPRQSPFFMPSHIGVFPYAPAQHCTVNLPPLYHKPGSSMYLGMESLDSLSPLDSLDSLSTLSISDYRTDFPQPSYLPQLQNHSQAHSQMNNHGNPTGMALGMPDNNVCFTAPVDLTKNPLADTHDFKQACSTCFIKTGPGVLDYTLGTEEHKCKKDALLGRIKHPKDKTWKLIRPRPTKNQYIGPYYICKEVAIGEECLYPGHCTFAYCQEEIDVWSMERKGFISRELLFDPLGPSCNVKLTVPKILQEHRGVFMFLCGVCFDHKPRIISKASQDSPSRCSHPVTKHDFEENKCLVHILKENTLRYSKVRPLYPQCQLDLCRHEVRYGCVREDECLFAHSLVELKVWMMQHEMGITSENIVHEARKFWSTITTAQGGQPPIVQRKFGPPNLKMLFVCGQCWRNGQLNEADKNKKYCSAKARHTWSKDRRVVLVSSNERKKWTTVRALPTKKPIPSQFEICMHVTAGKKCQYIGNCSFAHGTEERDLWTYMKENNIQDMDQLYELWLLSQKPGWSEENSNGVVRENGKQIVMPTDFAEEVSGNHCWLCGKNCNSDKQWQQHITSEKHKDKVFNSEDDQNCWQYRFPTGTFKVCERYLKGTCTEQEHCQLAHSNLELKEWIERREFLLMKLAKARKDHLIAPMDNDFGKYSFLLKDIQ